MNENIEERLRELDAHKRSGNLKESFLDLKEEEIQAGGGNLPPKQAGGGNLPPRQPGGGNLPPRENQDSARKGKAKNPQKTPSKRTTYG